MPRVFSRLIAGGSGTSFTDQQIEAKSWNPVDTNWKTMKCDFMSSSNFSAHNEGSLCLTDSSSGAGANITNGAGNEITGGFGAKIVRNSTANGGYSVYYLGQTTTDVNDSVLRYGMLFTLDAIPDATDDFIIALGPGSTFANTGGNEAFFLIDRSRNATNFVAHNRSGGSETDTDTGVAFTTGPHVIEMELDVANTTCKFAIDGSLVATHTTNIMTAANSYFQILNRTVASTATVDLNLHIAWIRQKPNAAIGSVYNWDSDWE